MQFNQMRDGPILFIRTIKTPRKHLEPKELAWQWEVKTDPALDYCEKPCLTCPKKTFFPRFRKAHITADVHSCKKKKKPLSWFDYFNFLLPDAMVAAKPPLRTCRKLLALRQDLCLDPQDWACCEVKCMKQPKEWYGQGVVHVIISNLPEVQPPLPVKPCSPPDHMIPRCVIAKKGLPPSTSKSCMIDYIYKKPYGDFFGFSTKPPSSRTTSDRFVCRVKCFEDLPKVHDKSIKLSCRWFAEFKDVECPKELYTRYKNVSITPCGDLKPVVSKDTTSTKIEIKKGVCGRQSLLRPTGLRNFSTRAPGNYSTEEILKAMNNAKPHLQPSKPSVNPDNIMKRGGIRPQLKEFTMPEIRPHRMPPSFRKGGAREMPKKPEILNKRFNKKQISGLPKVDTKSFSTSSAVFKDHKKKEEKEKYVPICSGCPGVREALSNVKKRKEIIKCRKRASGKCPGPTMPHGPLDPPILSPYWKCKTAAVSKCNQPRPAVVKKERQKMPCDQEKKFHTSAAGQLLTCCNDGCSPPPNKVKRLTPLEIPRESCFDKKYPKKEKEPQGILCKVASLFGIGCGKKKDCIKFDKKQISGLPKVDTKSFSTSSAVFKDHKKKEEKEKYVPICSGCPGVREAWSDVKKRKEIIKCRKRASGKCPGPTKPHGPLDPPILSPYWKCKTAAVSKCNRPRPPVVKKERAYKMPCEQEKKFHTSAIHLVDSLKEGCSPISNNVKRMAPVESWRQLPREHPFDKKAVKKGEGSILCFIARMFRIGCGKKKENESLNRQSGTETISKAYSTASDHLTNCKNHYKKNKKPSLPSRNAIVNSNEQINRSVHSTNSTLKETQQSSVKCKDSRSKNFVRDECFPRVDTSKSNKGFLCKIAAFFGIGCAKKSGSGCKKC